MSVDIHFWGTRGSFFQNGPESHEFGGHTSCISLHHEDQIYVIDAGSGLANFSASLTQQDNEEYPSPLKGHFFLSHLHMDHICGIPTFLPFWDAKFEGHFYCGMAQEYKGLQSALNTFYTPPFFPVSWDEFPCHKIHHDFKIGEILTPTPQCHVRTILLNHPGNAVGFGFYLDDKKIVYLCDTSHGNGFLEKFIEFSDQADLLIYDATFDSKKHAKYPHFGHSTWEKGCEIALKAHIPQLALTHHDIHSTDTHLRLVEEAAQVIIPGAFTARCGQHLILP